MKQIYIDFLECVKTQFKIKNITLKKLSNNNDLDLNNINLYQEITSYILYLWYIDTKDTRANEKDYVILPNNIKRTFYFNDIEFLDIAKILAYIKYDLLSGILDVLDYENFNKKNLKEYKTPDFKIFVKEQNIDVGNARTKAEYIEVILKKKDEIFNKEIKKTVVKKKKIIKKIKKVGKTKKKIIKKIKQKIKH